MTGWKARHRRRAALWGMAGGMIAAALIAPAAGGSRGTSGQRGAVRADAKVHLLAGRGVAPKDPGPANAAAAAMLANPLPEAFIASAQLHGLQGTGAS